MCRRNGKMRSFAFVSAVVYIIINTVLFMVVDRNDYLGDISKLDLYVHRYVVNHQQPTWPLFKPCTKEHGQNQTDRTYVCKWINDSRSDSTGHYVMYGSEFAVLHDVIIDPFRAAGRAGGENMSSLWNQKESEEYFKLKKSYFRLNCRNLPHHPFKGRNHLNDWFKSLTCVADLNSTIANQINGITIAVQRYEYVNLYQTMTDFYNVFLIMILFQIPPDTINILYIDGHPAGTLDVTWQRLFGKIYRAGRMANETKFAKMIWNIQSYNCPLQNCNLRYVPYLERFRDFFLFQHEITNAKVLNCSKLSVTIIWRRDYVAHPRNPSGVIQRKIKNEDEFLESVTKLLRGHEVKAIQLDTLSMAKQLEFVSETDILVGMHGAGLSHTLFLPKHGGLIELFPAYHKQWTSHFHAMTKWRRLHYVSWKNEDPRNEYPNKKTYIPTTIAISQTKKMVEKLCPQKLVYDP